MSATIQCAVNASFVVVVTRVESKERGRYSVDVEGEFQPFAAFLSMTEEVKVGDRLTLSLKGMEYTPA